MLMARVLYALILNFVTTSLISLFDSSAAKRTSGSTFGSERIATIFRCAGGEKNEPIWSSLDAFASSCLAPSSFSNVSIKTHLVC